jgi:hypothetical protein
VNTRKRERERERERMRKREREKERERGGVDFLPPSRENTPGLTGF